MKKAAFSLLLFALIACKAQERVVIKEVFKEVDTSVSEVYPKNIILMIGDGMGLGQISAGMFYQGNKTVLEEFPVIGLHKPAAYDKLITDSAAAATSFSSGVKTYNGAIGVNADTIPVKTILEEAEERGLATGLVATSTIVHATPASFIAHNKLRKNYEEIAEDFLKTEVDIFIGGGKKYFDRREDDRNLLAEFKGYEISHYAEKELHELNLDTSVNIGYLTSDGDPLPAAQGRDYLPSASRMAAEYLDRKGTKGFFLMIEGAQIDWGGHANNSDYILTEFTDFDKAITQVLEYVKRDGETLLIVTADHETGGYAIQPESTPDSLVTAFTSTYHTGTMIPVFAYGPQSERFAGIYENTAIFHKMRAAYNWAARKD